MCDNLKPFYTFNEKVMRDFLQEEDGTEWKETLRNQKKKLAVKDIIKKIWKKYEHTVINFKGLNNIS